MADEDFFRKVYTSTTPDQMVDVYDDWAERYDADVGGVGYATPRRVAEALAGTVANLQIEILDYGCGTGLSGVALSGAGFTRIDGCDPSPGMIARAIGLALYRRTFTFVPDDPPDAETLGRYGAIVATGVVSVGAAPPEALHHLWSGLSPGARLAFSYNGHTLEDAAYMDALAAVRANPACTTLFEEDGPHLPDLGMISRVFVLQRA
jgi:predicted TPR repeat methyltransferase